MNITRLSLCSAAILFCLFSTAAWSGPLTSTSDWINANLIDAQDGKLDVSDYLASTQGFLPVPIIITEPAVGYGLGLAVAYFHQPKEMDPEQHSHKGPPSITVGFGAKTENGTYLYGGAHIGVWKDDHVRYVGALAKVNVNMTFYVDDRSDGLVSNGVKFNIDGEALLQQMQFRLKESNWWLGANYLFFTAKNSFDLSAILPPELPDPQFDFDLAGLGLYIQYDNRNSVFTPTQGLSAKLEYKNHGDTWGSDFDYDKYKGSVFHYTPFGEYSSLGLRLVGEKVSGDTPFFGYPFVSLRGIPAMRYQGDAVGVLEVEGRYNFSPKWALIGFAGTGSVSSDLPVIDTEQSIYSYGLGGRYQIFEAQNIWVGIDIARGPEDTNWYIQVGHAW